MAKLYCWITCLLLGFLPAKAQEKQDRVYQKEFSFTTENDAFLLNKADAYYTNGFFCKIASAGEKNGKKTVRLYELGQLIYTPLSRKTNSKLDIDRPFCGYLYLKFGQITFNNSGAILQYDASVGAIGPASYGEDVQNTYHKMLGYSRFTGWSYQIQNALGLDFHLSYAKTVFDNKNQFRLIPIGELRAGTIFTNVSLGMYTCLGQLTNNSNSALWNARVQSTKEQVAKKSELFLFWYPQIICQAYNATVEGGLFYNGNAAALGVTNTWLFQQTWGACMAKGRWTTKLGIVYQSREAKAQLKVQRYGSIQLAYRMH